MQLDYLQLNCVLKELYFNALCLQNLMYFVDIFTSRRGECLEGLHVGTTKVSCGL